MDKSDRDYLSARSRERDEACARGDMGYAAYQQGRIDEYMAQNAIDEADLRGVINQVHDRRLAEPKLDKPEPPSTAFHLSGGYYFAREGDAVIIGHQTEPPVSVPLNEWASAVAHTTAAGETGQTWQAVLDLLGKRDA